MSRTEHGFGFVSWLRVSGASVTSVSSCSPDNGELEEWLARLAPSNFELKVVRGSATAAVMSEAARVIVRSGHRLEHIAASSELAHLTPRREGAKAQGKHLQAHLE